MEEKSPQTAFGKTNRHVMDSTSIDLDIEKITAILKGNAYQP
ncbi:hypothetical protein BSMD_027830 [Bacillus subtilis Miyagi-4]|nr:hypothetical protein BSNT_10211 [Bacillus subtilis subsp. natto BEST195]GAK80868.1 hypothetical protein BSMD_027830 [Bacillus subtilis Miyagi-4]